MTKLDYAYEAHRAETDETDFDISEIFQTIQGEGSNSGQNSLFIRLAGCNLRCEWCDTKYAWENKREMSQRVLAEMIRNYHKKTGSIHVVWTGGEPLLQERRIIQTIIATKPEHMAHHLETNGTIIPDKPHLFASIAVSPKDGTLHPRWLTIKNAYIKLVVKDIEEALAFRDKYPELTQNRLWVMAKSAPYEPGYLSGDEQIRKEKALASSCAKEGINFSPRLQVDYEWGRGK